MVGYIASYKLIFLNWQNWIFLQGVPLNDSCHHYFEPLSCFLNAHPMLFNISLEFTPIAICCNYGTSYNVTKILYLTNNLQTSTYKRSQSYIRVCDTDAEATDVCVRNSSRWSTTPNCTFLFTETYEHQQVSFRILWETLPATIAKHVVSSSSSSSLLLVLLLLLLFCIVVVVIGVVIIIIISSSSSSGSSIISRSLYRLGTRIMVV